MAGTGATTSGRARRRAAAGPALAVVEAEWALIERPGGAAAAAVLRVDLRSGACRLERRAAGEVSVLRAETVEAAAIEVASSAGGARAVTVPGVLMAVEMPGRAAGYARSPWVDALAPAAGCCEVVGLRIGCHCSPSSAQ